jgi:hypothetical protein
MSIDIVRRMVDGAWKTVPAQSSTSGGGDGGPQSLTDLTDVTGEPGPGMSPVGDHSGEFPLTQVPTQADIDAILALVVWHRVWSFDETWKPTNPSVVLTPDGVIFGPYADGGATGGSVRYHGLDGQPMSAIKNLAYRMRYLSDDMRDDAAPYMRIFTENPGGEEDHSTVYSWFSQQHKGVAGPFSDEIATQGLWRYDDDPGAGSGEFGTGAPFSQVLATHGDELITNIALTFGWQSGANLSGLLRWWQINGDHHSFGC